MSKVFISFILAVVFTFSVFSQNSNLAEKRKELSAKVETALQAGKLDDAIQSAEKLVELEKSAKSADTRSYTNSLLNLSRMKRDVFLILREKLGNRQIEPRDASAASEKARENAKEADALYRQALQLNEQGGRGETAQTADIKGELGWLLYNYLGSKQSIDDSEKFFLESIALNEKVRGKDADQTLFVVLKTGDFYNEMDNYEKALPFYERYIQTNEKTHGKNYLNLVNALRPMAKILFTTFQEKESEAIVKRIEALTQKSEKTIESDSDLHLRTKESVATTMKLIPIYQEEMKFFRAMLKSQNRTLNSNNISMVSKLKIVAVNVVANEDGKVIEAVADDKVKDKKLAKRAEETVSKWIVRPFSYNGTKHKIRGVLRYLELD
jgi:hypothetical protein